jgi:SAM-dependent methyltransferase
MAALDHLPPSAGKPAYAGFPRDLATLLLCPVDGGAFALESADRPDAANVREGGLRCGRCPHVVPIVDGIVRLLAGDTLDAEERHEIALRDDQTRTLSAERERAYWASLYSRRETASTLKALAADGECTAVDLGCGTGRYTALLSRACRRLLAVDFSLESLGWMARENAPGPNVGLVHGDITKLRLAPRAFDRALATTPLDSREQRLAMHRVAAEALGDGGVYVFSTEHYDLRSRLLGAPRAQRYRPGENLFFRLRRHEVEREAAPFFLDVRSKPINVSLPFSRRMPPPIRAALSAAAERVPWVRDLGDLVLVRARQPLREPQEGVGSPGSRAFRYVRRLVRGARADED